MDGHVGARPVVTVLLPVYNGEDYLAQALASVLGQTWPDLEVLAIDDGSTDGTSGVLASFADPRLRVHRIDHSGKSAALNAGIELATGEWIANMDADDVSHPERIEKQLRLIDRSGADVCGTAMQCIDSAGTRGTVVPVFRDDDEIKLSLRFQCPLVCGSVIARKSLLREVGGYADQPVAADYDLWVRLAERGCRFANDSDILYFYRIHEKSLTATRSAEQRSAADLARQRARQAVVSRPSASRTAMACVNYQVNRQQRDRWLARNLVVFQWRDISVQHKQHRSWEALGAGVAASAGAVTVLLQVLLWPLRLTKRLMSLLADAAQGRNGS